MKLPFGYKLVFVKIWSGNIWLPKASIIVAHYGTDKLYPCLCTNRFKNFTYRLKPKIIKLKNAPTTSHNNG